MLNLINQFLSTLPTFKWKWRRIIISPSHGWKKAFLMLLYRMSTLSPRTLVYLSREKETLFSGGSHSTGDNMVNCTSNGHQSESRSNIWSYTSWPDCSPLFFEVSWLHQHVKKISPILIPTEWIADTKTYLKMVWMMVQLLSPNSVVYEHRHLLRQRGGNQHLNAQVPTSSATLEA